MQSSPPAWLPQGPSELSRLVPGSPPWISLVFECNWIPLIWSSLHAWLSLETSDLSGLNPDSPPWASFLGWSMLIVYFAFIVHTLFTFCIIFCFQWFILHCSNAFVQLLSWTDYCQYCQLSLLFFNYCSLFWYWKCIPGISIQLSSNIYELTNIILHNTRPLLSLYRVLWRPFTTIDRRGYTEPISPLGVEEIKKIWLKWHWIYKQLPSRKVPYPPHPPFSRFNSILKK
jgi:hypothetical protein